MGQAFSPCPKPILSEVDPQQSDNVIDIKNNRNPSFKSNEHSPFLFHLGVLLFAPYFQQLKENGLEKITQWLVSVLLGAQNIEQTKELHYNSLSTMLGQVIKHPTNQRTALKEIATNANTDKILHFNGQLVKVKEDRDFYYDPHTKHYTGHLKILDTWCPSVRLADKGINMDFIHTTKGYPVFFDTTDNFYDLRERYPQNIKRFRTLMGFSKDEILTFIVDRGIFSEELFHAIAQSPVEHIITWEKGYNRDKWDDNAGYGVGCIIKKRNHNNDHRLVHYQYQDCIWDTDKEIRQIIVRILDKNGNTLLEVSILTDDRERDPNQIIELMLKRWVQENDFKYLKKHFGINEITTYAFVDYKDLRDKIEDKLYTGGKYKELTKEIKNIRTKLKSALFSQYKFQQKHPDSETKLTKREQERKSKIWDEIGRLDTILKQYSEQRKEYADKTSKLDELIDQNYQKLETNTKSFFDAIKILARNIFYLELLPFKNKYNNFRDDHVLFRNVTRAAGTITSENGLSIIHLQPTMVYPKKIKNLFIDVFGKINEKNPCLPDGSNKKIFLTQLEHKSPWFVHKIAIKQTYKSINVHINKQLDF